MTVQINNVLREHIITLLNLDDLPESQRAMLLDKMVDVVNGRLLLRVLDSLNADSRKEFEKTMDGDDNFALENFLTTKIPNFVDMISEETAKLKTEMVGQLKTKWFFNMPVSEVDALQQKVERLREIHADFLIQIEKLEKEEKELARKVRKAIDDKKIHGVLDRILKMREN